MRSLTATLIVLLILACDRPAPMEPMEPRSSLQTEKADAPMLPFHMEETDWHFVQVQVPAGMCTRTLDPGMSYLWLTQIQGAGNATHMGAVTVQGHLCVFGQLLDPTVDPPNNGIPAGWWADLQITAANGDRLDLIGWVAGFTAPPGTPDAMIIQDGEFTGGTGRFANARGNFRALVDPAGVKPVIYDGLIRYGR